MTDSLNGGFSVQSTTSSLGGTATLKLAPEQVAWTGLELPAGATATFTISGTVLPGVTVGAVLVDIAVASPNPAEIDTDAGSVSLDYDTVVLPS